MDRRIKQPQHHYSLSADIHTLVQRVKHDTGITSNADIIRQALRLLSYVDVRYHYLIRESNDWHRECEALARGEQPEKPVKPFMPIK